MARPNGDIRNIYVADYDDEALREYYFIILDVLTNTEDAPLPNDMMSTFVRKLWLTRGACRERGIGLPVLPEHIEALLILEGLS